MHSVPFALPDFKLSPHVWIQIITAHLFVFGVMNKEFIQLTPQINSSFRYGGAIFSFKITACIPIYSHYKGFRAFKTPWPSPKVPAQAL